MNIHIKLTGEAERTVDEIIKRGYAANKTEAIRHAIIECKDKHLSKEEFDENEKFYRRMSAYANRDVWDNEEDEKMTQWYLKKVKK